MKNMIDILKKNIKGEKTLMVVFPHPDDESVATVGLLLATKQYGWKTVVVSLTHGGAGKVHIHPNGKSTTQVRLSELKTASKIIGVDKLIIGGFDDGKLKETESRWKPWLVNKLQEHSPMIITTYDHSGISGHPDHIILSIELKKIAEQISKKRKISLFWVSVPVIYARKFIRKDLLEYISKPTHTIFLNLFSMIKKFKALKAHKSQNLIPLKKLAKRLFLLKREWYYEVDLKKNYKHRFVDFEI